MEETLELLTGHPLEGDGRITRMFRAVGAHDFAGAARHIWRLPYGRIEDRAQFWLVLKEGRGTCTTKHALLTELAREQAIDLELMLGIYEMGERNTPGVGGVLQKYGLPYLPEAHCYLRYQGVRIDVTGVPPGAEPIESFLYEEPITVEKIGLTRTTAGTVSLSFASYLRHFLEIDPRPAALGLLTAVGALAVSGIKQSARVIIVLSLIQVSGLMFVVAIGAPHIGEVDLLSGPGMGGILSGAALVFFAFIGFDEVITLAEETRDPTRTVPRALLLALAVSSLLYIAVAVAAVSVLGSTALGASPRPLTDVMAHVLGDRSASLLSAIAMISTTNTTLLALTAASRLLYGMATKEVLPGWLGIVHPVTRVPIRAILCAGVGAGLFGLVGDLTLIAAVTDFAIYFVFLAINLTVILLRWKKPELPRPFAVPWSVGHVPVLPSAAFVSVLVMISQLELRAVWMGLGLSLVGLIVAFMRRAGREST